MKTVKKIIIYSILIPALAGAIFCSSAQTTEEESNEQLGAVIFSMECTGGQAVRIHTDRKEKFVIEKGPVQLPEKVDCSDMRSRDEKQIVALKRNGIWEDYYKGTTKAASRGEYRLGKKVGEWKTFSETGDLVKSTMWVDGKKEGPEISYFSGSREWREKGQNADGKKTGLWQMRLAKDSNCINEGEYKEGKKEGQWKECSMDESNKQWYVSYQGTYKEDLKDGPAVHFHPNGQKMAEGSYFGDQECLKSPPADGPAACGKRTGAWTIYFPDGKTAAQGSYDPKTGRRGGNWVEYYRTGEKLAEGPRGPNRVGMWTFYKKNGMLISKFSFANNDFAATSAELYINGVLTGKGGVSNLLVNYHVDTDSLTIAGKDPDNLAPADIKKMGAWVEYYPNGQKSGEGTYNFNKKHGAWIQYSQSGQKTMEGDYNMDMRNGHWKIYDAAGSLREEGDYMMGKKMRIWKEFQNGALVRTLTCNMDVCK